MKEVETTCTLLSSIKATCGDGLCPLVVAEFDEAMTSPTLTLGQLERLEFAALAALLRVEEEEVSARAASVRKAMSEWRNPEARLTYRTISASLTNEGGRFPHSYSSGTWTTTGRTRGCTR